MPPKKLPNIKWNPKRVAQQKQKQKNLKAKPKPKDSETVDPIKAKMAQLKEQMQTRTEKGNAKIKPTLQAPVDDVIMPNQTSTTLNTAQTDPIKENKAQLKEQLETRTQKGKAKSKPSQLSAPLPLDAIMPKQTSKPLPLDAIMPKQTSKPLNTAQTYSQPQPNAAHLHTQPLREHHTYTQAHTQHKHKQPPPNTLQKTQQHTQSQTLNATQTTSQSQPQPNAAHLHTQPLRELHNHHTYTQAHNQHQDTQPKQPHTENQTRNHHRETQITRRVHEQVGTYWHTTHDIPYEGIQYHVPWNELFPTSPIKLPKGTLSSSLNLNDWDSMLPISQFIYSHTKHCSNRSDKRK